MSGALQAVFQNQRSFGEPPPTVIGQAYGGGYYAGQIGVSSVATHYLVVGPMASAYNATGLRYKTSNTEDAGATSVINGPANSASINDSDHPAAQFCEGLTIGGFSDWYLPAINELEICYFNLKPSTNSNYTGGAEPMGWPNGSNPNAVPSRASAYTSGTPAQTSATIFKTGNAEAFPYLNGGNPASYWSSTQAPNVGTSRVGYAACTNFETGYQYRASKNTTARFVRAVRRVAV